VVPEPRLEQIEVARLKVLQSPSRSELEEQEMVRLDAHVLDADHALPGLQRRAELE
jgi:hypothetical protein